MRKCLKAWEWMKWMKKKEVSSVGDNNPTMWVGLCLCDAALCTSSKERS